MPRLTALRLLAWRSRRLLRALVVALLVGLAVRLAAPPPAPTELVAVAARPVPAGRALSPDDVRLVRLRSTGAPSTAQRSIEPLLGRRAAVDLPPGIALVPSLVAAGRFALEPPAGTVVVPVTIDGSTALRVGDGIEVVADAGCAASSDPLAVAALVIGVGDTAEGPTDGEGDEPIGLGLGIGAIGSSGRSADSSILLAVDAESGRRIAGITRLCSLGAVIVP